MKRSICDIVKEAKDYVKWGKENAQTARDQSESDMTVEAAQGAMNDIESLGTLIDEIHERAKAMETRLEEYRNTIEQLGFTRKK